MVLNYIKRRLLYSKIFYVYERFVHKFSYEDIFLVSFPKSGNTWMRFMLSSIYLWEFNRGRSEINYFNIHTYIKDLQLCIIKDNHIGLGLPRIIKSHRPFSPNYSRVIYVVRDVRDVMVSYFKYLNRNGEKFSDIDEVLYHPIYGVQAWVNHVESWLSSSTNLDKKLIIVKYENLIDDSNKELSKIMNFIGYNISNDAMDWIIYQGSKDRIKYVESTFGRARSSQVPFLRKGEKNQWRDHLTDSHLNYILKVAGDTLFKLGYNI